MRVSNTISIADLTAISCMRNPDHVWDEICDSSISIYPEAYKKYIAQGKSENEAEELALDAQSNWSDEQFVKYMDELEAKACKNLYFYDLNLSIHHHFHGKSARLKRIEYSVSPSISWKSSLTKLRHLMGAIGTFAYSNQELLDSLGTNSPKQAVMNCIHYISHHREVYGL